MARKQVVKTTDDAAANIAVTNSLVAQIRQALMQTMERIPAIDGVPEGAVLWKACKDIKADLSTIQRDVATRIVAVSPTRVIQKGKPEEREVPVKEQAVDGVGIVTITNSKNRTWHNPQEMMHNIVEMWPALHQGEILQPNEVINLMFKLFSVGDMRVTALREAGLADRYEQEPWVTETYADAVTVVVQ